MVTGLIFGILLGIVMVFFLVPGKITIHVDTHSSTKNDAKNPPKSLFLQQAEMNNLFTYDGTQQRSAADLADEMYHKHIQSTKK